MHPSTPVRRRGPNGRFLSSATVLAPAITPPQAPNFITLPAEVRCGVYRALFDDTEKGILRPIVDAKARDASYIPLDNAIMRTCKTVCAEALPIFYSTQKFHCSAELDGITHLPQFLPEHTKWVKHLSIEVTVNSRTSSQKLDTTVEAQVQRINKYFPKLASFTLHVIPAIEETGGRRGSIAFPQAPASDVFDQGAAAKALRTLRLKLPLLRLRIVMFGKWDDLHRFRSAIASEGQWVQGPKCWGGWPDVTLTWSQSSATMVRQRRYTLAGAENVVHPLEICIRIFNLLLASDEAMIRERRRLNDARSVD